MNNESRLPTFREEALKYRAEQFLGEVFIAQKPSFWIFFTFSTFVASAVIALIFFGQFTRTVSAPGYISPSTGAIKVFARDQGFISEKRFSTGDKVKKGDVLFILSLERTGVNGEDIGEATAKRLRARKENLAGEAQTQTLLLAEIIRQKRARAAALGMEAGRLESEIVVQTKRFDSLRVDTERFENLAKQQFISPTQVQQKRDAELGQAATLEALQRTLLGIQRDIAATDQEVASSQLSTQLQVDQITRSSLALEQDLLQLQASQELLVRAPIGGTVTAVQGDVGQLVSFQQASTNVPLATIIPADAVLEAILLVPSSSIGLLEVGQPALIKYRSFPYQRYGIQKGSIKSIDASPLAPGEMTSMLPIKESSYKVIVSLDKKDIVSGNRSLPIQVGMLLDVEIPVETLSVTRLFLDVPNRKTE